MAWSRAANAARARRRIAGPPPEPGIPRPVPRLKLHTIRVESHLAGTGFEIVVRQARRRNQVVVETFGRASKPHGIDWLTRHLRARLVTRWIRS